MAQRMPPTRKTGRRAVFIDEPAFDRHQPGLEQHEQRKRPLDRGAIPSELLLDVGDEECPTILVVGYHHHCGYTDSQLCPAKSITDTCGRSRHSVNHIRHCPSRLAVLLGASSRAVWYIICQ